MLQHLFFHLFRSDLIKNLRDHVLLLFCYSWIVLKAFLLVRSIDVGILRTRLTFDVILPLRRARVTKGLDNLQVIETQILLSIILHITGLTLLIRMFRRSGSRRLLVGIIV